MTTEGKKDRPIAACRGTGWEDALHHSHRVERGTRDVRVEVSVPIFVGHGLPEAPDDPVLGATSEIVRRDRLVCRESFVEFMPGNGFWGEFLEGLGVDLGNVVRFQ